MTWPPPWPQWTTASPAPRQACAATWPLPCTSAASKTKPGATSRKPGNSPSSPAPPASAAASATYPGGSPKPPKPCGISSRSNATSVPEFQISPAAISPGTDASGTHSIRSTSVVSVGSPIFSGSRPTNTTCSESTMPTIGWNVIRCSTRPAR